MCVCVCARVCVGGGEGVSEWWFNVCVCVCACVCGGVEVCVEGGLQGYFYQISKGGFEILGLF